jgi:branched-chain amino acid transport system ATP-binding protein/neutral amino acid transport system ATP-binding protein
MLKIKNLKKYFGGVKAVNDCSFEIEERKITALIGPNGAGKSTVFNLISGIIKPDGGEILFNGKNITKLNPEKISNLGISRLFQQTMLFNNLTVKENLLLAFDNEDTKFWKNFFGKNKLSNEKLKKIKAMLELIKMENFENKKAKDLSYGQKRLVELIRTIINPHILLMLDEPVAGVNPQIRMEIAEMLKKLKTQGETILLIEHDMNFTLGVSDKIIVMDEGKVIAEGKPEEIKNNPQVLEAYLGD